MNLQVKYEELYKKCTIKFPIIGSVMFDYGKGCILTDSTINPTHIFVINEFGFCQELFDEYNCEFAKEVRSYIISCKRKLRLYNPDDEMTKWLDGFERAKPSRRIHYWGNCNGLGIDSFDNIKCIRMLEYDNRYEFGLDLGRRFYKNEKDFLLYGKPVCASSIEGEPVGIIYAAGYDGKRNEVDVFVSERFREQGVGTILSSYYSYIVEMSGEELTWDCYSNNYASRYLADKLGFSNAKEYLFYNIEAQS